MGREGSYLIVSHYSFQESPTEEWFIKSNSSRSVPLRNQGKGDVIRAALMGESRLKVDRSLK